MLTLSQNLPPQILIGAEAVALGGQITAMGGHWFHADPDHVLMTDEAISGWRAQGAGPEVVAVPTAPNLGGSAFDLDQSAFVMQAGVHCGFTLPGAVTQIARFTAAVIYTSIDDDARSLFALNTGAANTMIFLSESEGMIFAKDRAGAVEVALPAPAAPRRFVILSFDNNTLTLWVNGISASASGNPEGLDAPADLFIGCRSNRPGLAKTLGASRIHDVMFWPDSALLGSSDAADAAALTLLRRYQRWAL